MGLGSAIRDPEKSVLDPRSRDQKGSGARIRIRNFVPGEPQYLMYCRDLCQVGSDSMKKVDFDSDIGILLQIFQKYR